MSLDTLVKILLIAVSLTLDVASVSIGTGLKKHHPKFTSELKISLVFALFHVFMPILGWVIGTSLKGFIQSIDHWIAFALLSFLGLKMLKDSFGKDKRHKLNLLNLNNLFLLGVATSIDALVVGISFGVLEIPALASSLIIGLVAFFMSLVGFLLGRKIGMFLEKKAEVLAGVVLIGIGLKTLIEHL